MWGMPDILLPRTLSLDPKLKISGNRLVGVSSVGAPLCVLRSTLQVSLPLGRVWINPLLFLPKSN
jgi:hypothetical protein